MATSHLVFFYLKPFLNHSSLELTSLQGIWVSYFFNISASPAIWYLYSAKLCLDSISGFHIYFLPLLFILFWSAKTKGTWVQSSKHIISMLQYSDKLFLLLMFKPCLFQFNVFSCASCFFGKRKERTVQLLFALVILE